MTTMDERMTTALPCLLHTRHMPGSHVNHFHHVWPLGDGGPNIAANKVVVCATGHANIHKLLNLFKLHMGQVPYVDLRTFSHQEREYAKLGYERIARQAM